jgi:hypothetical protein
MIHVSSPKVVRQFFSFDSRYIVTASEKRTVRIWAVLPTLSLPGICWSNLKLPNVSSSDI